MKSRLPTRSYGKGLSLSLQTESWLYLATDNRSLSDYNHSWLPDFLITDYSWEKIGFGKVKIYSYHVSMLGVACLDYNFLYIFYKRNKSKWQLLKYWGWHLCFPIPNCLNFRFLVISKQQWYSLIVIFLILLLPAQYHNIHVCHMLGTG